MSESTVMNTYVPSNGYYGYVPPIGQLRSDQSDCIYKSNVSLEQNAGGPVKTQENYYCDNNVDMETDDQQQQQQPIRNGMHCQNNHYVIPEMVASGGNGDLIVNNGTNFATMQMHWQLSKENRKRTNEYDPEHCQGNGKKFKSGRESNL
uniref:Uncharacterized protein n=1 Tax=Bracon brevicornis TaxID=1563983 RepID=A0A6V7LPY1_9HYME